jgi:hypothetical protein
MQANALRRTHLFVPGALVLGIVVMVCVAVIGVQAQPAALPPTVMSAHSVFIENETGFAELQYTAVLELNKWGHFELADSREKADLVMVLRSGTHVHTIPDGQFPRATGLNAFTEEDVPKGHTRIALLDPKSGATLWSDYHKTEGGKVKSGHLLDELRQAYADAERTKSKS